MADKPRDLSSGRSATAALRGTCPEHALTDALAPSEAAVRDLLQTSNSAFASGRRDIPVPAVLAGGRLDWHAPAGALRRQLIVRLDALVRAGRLQRSDARAVTARFGLEGVPGSADQARTATQRRRQATSNAVNRAIKIVAADLTMHPLMPVAAPRLDLARRQVIVGAVLSLMNGQAEDFPNRLYAHMHVRAELLGDPIFPVAAEGATDRQRRHRLAKRWLAITSDHLDRDQVPWASFPQATSDERSELKQWRRDPTSSTPSVGAVRALVSAGEDSAFEMISNVQGTLGLLLDGYRPLIELLRVAAWAHAPSQSPAWSALPPERVAALRSTALLVVAELLATRGYPDAAVLYAARAHDVQDQLQGATASLRLRRLIVLESVSYLRGAPTVTETRAWHEALADHLQRHGWDNPGEPLAIAHALMRTEHAAWTAGVPSGATVAELLEPIAEQLAEALARTTAENRQRFEISRARLAAVIDDDPPESAAPTMAARDGVAPARSGRYDEWYCAYPVAVARWDARGNARGDDEWRR